MIKFVRIRSIIKFMLSALLVLSSLGSSWLPLEKAFAAGNKPFTIGFESSESYTMNADVYNQPASGVKWGRGTNTVLFKVDPTAGKTGAGLRSQSTGAQFEQIRFLPTAAELGVQPGPPLNSKMSFSLDVNMNDQPGAYAQDWEVGIRDLNGTNQGYAITLSINADGTIQYKNGGTWISVKQSDQTTVMKLVPNTYATISGILDYATKKYKLYVNGVPQSSGGNISFTSSIVDEFGYIAIKKLSTAPKNISLDNVTMGLNAAPELTNAIVGNDARTITLQFDRQLQNQLAALQSSVSLATYGNSFSPLQSNDQVFIQGNSISIQLAAPLLGSENVLKISGGALTDIYGNTNAIDILTPPLKGLSEAAPSLPPVLTGETVNPTNTTVTLQFDQPIMANTTNLKEMASIASDGVQFKPLGENDQIFIQGNTIVIRLGYGLKGTENKIKLQANAIRSLNGGAVLGNAIVTDSLRGVTEPTMRSLLNEHPRLLATKADFQRIQTHVANQTSPYKEWFAKLDHDAQGMLQLAPSTYNVTSGEGLLATSRQVLTRVQTLAMMYRVQKESNIALATAYANRAWTELNTAAAFPDWYPYHFLDTAEMTAAFAIGYDWLYDYLDESQKLVVRNAIVNKGLLPGKATYDSHYNGAPKPVDKDNWGDFGRNGWVTINNNWNFVTNGGLGLGALAIGDEEPVLSEQIIQFTKRSLPNVTTEFAPDGGWMEGATYWSYAVDYFTTYIASLQSSLGTDMGLLSTPALDQTSLYPIYLSGSTGQAVNFGDGLTASSSTPAMFYYAKQFHHPEYARWRKALTLGEPKDLIWYDPAYDKSLNESQTPLDKYFGKVELFSMRSSWDQSSGTSVSFKAGDNLAASHGDLDVGTFVMDALGVRWAQDFGLDSYLLPNYFQTGASGERWKYYTKRAEGHNTLLVNPGTAPDQDPTAKAVISRFGSSEQEAFAIADLTSVYKDVYAQGGSLTRGIRLFDNRRSVMVQDELVTQVPVELWWSMHTAAETELSGDGKSIILKSENKRLKMTIVSPAAASFTVRNSDYLSPAMSSSPLENSRAGIQNVTIYMPNAGTTTLSVLMTPYYAGDVLDEPVASLKPLAQWSVDASPAAKLDSIAIDGIPISNFQPGNFSYSRILPLGATIPNVTASVSDPDLEVHVIQADLLQGSAWVEVQSRTHTKQNSRYKVSFIYPIDSGSILSYSGFQPGNTPENTLDGNGSTRWSAQGAGQWIQYNLGQDQLISEVQLAFNQSDARKYTFDVLVSTDGITYTKVLDRVISSLTPATNPVEYPLQSFSFSPIAARLVKIVGYGSTVNDWNNYTEVRIGNVTPVLTPMPASLESVAVNPEATQVLIGKQTRLTVTGKLTNGSEVSKAQFAAIKYRSSDSSVLTINEDGVVTGHKLGRAFIAADVTYQGVTRKGVTQVIVRDRSSYTVSASADSYVNNGGNASSNYGAATRMLVKLNSQAGLDRRTFLQFDLSDVPAGSTGAKLYLFGDQDNDTGDFAVWGVGDSWTERGLTYQNMPQQQGNPIVGNVKFSVGSGSWKSIDITPYVNNQLSAGDKIISLEVVGTSNATLAGLESREGVNGAYLLFSYPLILTTGVSVSPSEFELTVGAERDLEAVVTPADAYNPTTVWSSSDTAVAVVDAQTGKVKAIGEGKATITVMTEEGGHSAVSLLTVKSIPPPAPPVVVSPIDAVVTRSGQVVISLQAEFGVIVKVRNGAEVIATAVGAGDTAVSVPLPVLADGVYLLTATSTDAKGKESEAATIPTITVAVTPADVTPTIASYNKGAPLDVDFTITANGNEFSGLQNGAYTLVPKVDYTVSGDVYRIKSSYLSTLPVGTATITFDFATAADKQVTIQVTPDTLPPSIPEGLQVTGTSKNSVSLAWSASADAGGTVTYELYCGAERVAAGITQTTYTAAGLQPDTAYSFSVRAVDSAGNASDLSSAVTVDLKPPVTVSSTSPAQPDGQSGWYRNPVTITLTATDNMSGVDKTEYSLDGGASWMPYTAPVTVNDNGQRTFLFRSKDKEGNVEVAQSLSLQLDTNSPISSAALAPAQPDGQIGWYRTPVSIDLSTVDAVSGVASTEYTIDGGVSWLPYAGTIVIGQEGQTTVGYRSTDKAGNQETTRSVSVSVDSTAPAASATVASTQGGQNGWYSHPVTVTLNAADNLSGVTQTLYSLDGGAHWNVYTGAFQVSQDGSYTILYRSKDNAGNEESVKTIVFDVDATAPVIAVGIPTEGGRYRDTDNLKVQFSVTESGGSGLATETTTATLDGSIVQNGQSIDLTGLALGNHTFVVSASDQAGNVNTVTITFLVYADRDSLNAQINRFATSGAIDSSGVANSLRAKVKAGSYSDLIAELQSQSGKHIKASAAALLIRDAQHILSH
ncbi:OmpL47-type beta-barrel domain-containing protein [Paenibacillus roseipurpureus]|uniref:Ig-like domain-containing protein n=1 Tax=Paenibacillus roseopurpureus TaxID=2918901 RepID=A0AA96RLT9_9BACL|nr:Ig-like domain-containing protein [Paenibacillus sp. MBLB1832]WNR45769.1 Ig-like domain-containing protein [Paenibacillus sp. MBLB1832]